MSRKGGDKNRSVQQQEIFVNKGIELDELRNTIRALKDKLGSTQEDVRARDEQIQKLSDEVQASLQTIKGLDRKEAELRSKLKTLQETEETEADRLKNAAEADGVAGVSRVVTSLGRLLHQVDKLAEAVEQESGSMALADDSGRPSVADLVDPSKRFATVKVVFKSNSCTFPVEPGDSFSVLLKKATHYWSLPPGYVLTDSGDFVWPMEQPVQRTLHESDDVTVRLMNGRGRREDETADVVKQAEKQEAEKQMRMAELGAANRRLEEGEIDILGDGKEEEDAEEGAGGPPLTAAERRRRAKEAREKQLRGGAHGVTGVELDEEDPLASIEATKLRNPVSVRTHLDLFCYILFGVMFLNAVYLRVAIPESFSVFSSVDAAFFQREFAPSSAVSSSVPTSAALRAEMITFEDISVVDQVWLWLEGPVYTGLAKSGRTSTTALTPLVCPTDRPHRVAVGDSVRCCGNSTLGACSMVVGGAVNRNASLCTLVPGAYADVVVGGNNTRTVLAPPSMCVTAVARHALQRYNYLHGGIHLRQLRVRNDSCSVPSRYDKFERSCRSPFNPASHPDAVSTDPFGPMTAGFVHSGVVGGWSPGNLSYTQLESVPGFRRLQAGMGVAGEYDTAGFDFVLPPDPAAFLAAVKYLKDNEWLDAQSRAVVASMNIYNANYDIMSVTTALVELTPSGRVNANYRIKSMRLNQESSARDGTRALLEWLCLGTMSWLLLGMLYDVSTIGFTRYFGLAGLPVHPGDAADDLDERRRNRERYKELEQEERLMEARARHAGELEEAAEHARNMEKYTKMLQDVDSATAGDGLDNNQRSRAGPWNIPLVALILVYGVDFTFRRLFLSAAADLSLSWDVAPPQPYKDLHALVYYSRASVVLDAACVLLGTVQVFKFFNLNPYMSMIWLVVGEAWTSILNYMFLFVVIVGSFGVAGHLLFGHQLDDYLYIDTAFNTLIRMAVGNLDYEQLQSVRGYAAPVFFVSYMVIGFFIATNLYLAILNTSFTKVADGVRARGYYWLPQPKRDLRSKLPELWLKKKEDEKKKREFQAQSEAAHASPSAQGKTKAGK